MMKGECPVEPKNRMIESRNFIGKVGSSIRELDSVMISLIAKRMELVEMVELWKHHHRNQPILRKDVEDKRLEEIRKIAKLRGVNPNLAHSVLYMIICESCRLQIDRHQQREGAKQENCKTWEEFLRNNLIALTDAIANEYDRKYEQDAPFATKILGEFEEKILKTQLQALRALNIKGLAIDIGCATGRVAFELSPWFEKVIGWDMSPKMISVANGQKSRGSNFAKFRNVEFAQGDLEEKIARVGKGSVSLAVANFGTGSEIRNFQIFLKNLKSALKKDGRFFLSFYNAGALVYKFFVPWTVSLVAEIDPIGHCLSVRVDEKDFQIFARPYTVREIRKIFRREKGLSVSTIVTYPTISAFLPEDFFQDERSRKEIKLLDGKLSKTDKGAYIIVAGRKTS